RAPYSDCLALLVLQSSCPPPDTRAALEPARLAVAGRSFDKDYRAERGDSDAFFEVGRFAPNDTGTRRLLDRPGPGGRGDPAAEHSTQGALREDEARLRGP